LCLAMGVLLAACFRGSGRLEEVQVMASSEGKTIEDVLETHSGHLLSIPGVVATALGICNELPCIKVYVLEKTTALQAAIPEALEGYPVCLEQAGKIRALPNSDAERP